jgi:hypothetical protein
VFSFCPKPPVHSKVDERVNPLACNEEDAAAMAAIAAVRAAPRNVFLTAKTRAAVAAAAGFDA